MSGEEDPVNVYMRSDTWPEIPNDDDGIVSEVDPTNFISDYGSIVMLGFVIANIVGIKQNKGAIHGREMVTLIRDPLNRCDSNAIKVINIRDLQVGFVEKSVSDVLALLLDDDLISIEGIVPNIQERRRKNVKIPFQIYVFATRENVEEVYVAITMSGLELIRTDEECVGISEIVRQKVSYSIKPDQSSSNHKKKCGHNNTNKRRSLKDSANGGSAALRYRGVRHRPSGRYGAEIIGPLSKKKRWLGTFDTAEEAACGYDCAARVTGKAKTNSRYPISDVVATPPSLYHYDHTNMLQFRQFIKNEVSARKMKSPPEKLENTTTTKITKKPSNDDDFTNFFSPEPSSGLLQDIEKGFFPKLEKRESKSDDHHQQLHTTSSFSFPEVAPSTKLSTNTQFRTQFELHFPSHQTVGEKQFGTC